MVVNLDASIKARLKNVARKTNRDYNFICIQYLQERFLARLSKSAYRDNFILKGALLLFAYKLPETRPSKDVDLLGVQISNNSDNIIKAITQIVEIDLHDAVIFYSDRMMTEDIAGNALYNGIRIRIAAKVGGDRQQLQIDIGFGDTIIDGPLNLTYPTILENEPPTILVYSLESAIAEKWEAVVNYGLFGSRMKDLFDIWYLLHEYKFDEEKLSRAISATFEKRHTPIADSEFIFSREFAENENKNVQWQAFLNRSLVQTAISYEEVIVQIKNLLAPILRNITES